MDTVALQDCFGVIRRSEDVSAVKKDTLVYLWLHETLNFCQDSLFGLMPAQDQVFRSLGISLEGTSSTLRASHGHAEAMFGRFSWLRRATRQDLKRQAAVGVEREKEKDVERKRGKTNWNLWGAACSLLPNAAALSIRSHSP